jgi:hypothetical protein
VVRGGDKYDRYEGGLVTVRVLVRARARVRAGVRGRWGEARVR